MNIERPKGHSLVTSKEHHIDMVVTGLLCFFVGLVAGYLAGAITWA